MSAHRCRGVGGTPRRPRPGFCATPSGALSATDTHFAGVEDALAVLELLLASHDLDAAQEVIESAQHHLHGFRQADALRPSPALRPVRTPRGIR